MSLKTFSTADLEAGKVDLPGRGGAGSGIFSEARRLAAETLKEKGKAIRLTDLVNELQRKFKDKDRQQVYVQARAALKSYQGLRLRNIHKTSWVVRVA